MRYLKESLQVLIYIFLYSLTFYISGYLLKMFYINKIHVYVINAIILKLVELVLNQNVRFNSILSLLFISFIMTIFNFFIKEILVKPFLKVINCE